MARRLLIVVTPSVSEADARACADSHAGKDAEILVVVPASDISRLDWLTNAEDDARAKAAEQAEAIAEAAPSNQTETRVGDTDPIKAVEDAVRTFNPDEVLLLTRPDEEAPWLEKGKWEEVQRRLALPTTQLVLEN